MKYLLAQPSGPRFKWELDVFLTNLRSLDQETPVVLLFLRENSAVVEHFRGRYPNLEIYVYEDDRKQRNYIPTIRPYLVWRWLSDHPEAQDEDYFQVDSDIIFRELPRFVRMPLNGKRCWVSDCESYIGYKYLMGCKMGKEIVDRFAAILNVPVSLIRDTPGGGAQWLISKPTAQLWWHIWQDSQILYDFLDPLPSNIQKWTAEMWAELYNLAKFGWDVQISDELSFCRPTDPIATYEKVKILHNAGVTNQTKGLFYKGAYLSISPFGENMGWVDRSKAGWHYAKAIEKAYNHNV